MDCKTYQIISLVSIILSSLLINYTSSSPHSHQVDKDSEDIEIPKATSLPPSAASGTKDIETRMATSLPPSAASETKDIETTKATSLPPSAASEQVVGCHRVPLIVNLTKIYRFIHLPKSSDIGDCAGICSLVSHRNDNYYLRWHLKQAAVESMLEPCCVPTKYRPLQALIRIKNTFSIARLSNVVVSECGCMA